MKKLLSISFCLFGLILYPQKTINAQKFEVFALDNGVLHLFKKTKNDQFLRYELAYDDEKEEEYGDLTLLFPFVENQENEQTLAEIRENYEHIFFVDSLAESRFSDFQGKSFAYFNAKDSIKERIQIINRHLAKNEILEFTDSRFIGFGVTYNIRPNDTIARWRVEDAEFYTPMVVNFGKNKRIYLLNEEDESDLALIPKKNGLFFVNSGEINRISEVKNENSYEEDWHFYNKNAYFVQKPKGKKRELIDIYGEKVLPKAYDSISVEQFFIIGKNKKRTDIYTSNLQKMNFGKVKVAYPYHYGIEILNEKGVGYYRGNSEKIGKLHIIHNVCGTISEYDYQIKKDSLSTKNPYKIHYHYDGTEQGKAENKEFVLTDRTADEELSFINGEKVSHWDGNSGFLYEIYPEPEYIRVKKGNRFGLFEYDYENHHFTAKEDYPKAVTYEAVSITGKEILPIEYDFIEQQKDGLLFFGKDGKVGIFGKHQKPNFDSLKKASRSFYEATKDGKKFWLDKRSFELYER